MSSTFVADEIALDRRVVLKTLPSHLSDGLSIDRFEREIRLAARLQHAFLVPLLSAGVTDGIPWYTMPLVHGESVRARLNRDGPMPAAEVASVLRDAADALAYAHGQGVIHRDIKPDNILLSGEHALITDFGVAKAITASAVGNLAVTAAGVGIGTPAYMAPEQATGAATSDHRADLYALGATGYEMLSGRQLFGDRPASELMAAHVVASPQPLGEIAPGAPSELVGLIEHLLAKNPDERPASAQQVVDDLALMLSRWRVGDPVSAPALASPARALGWWASAFIGVIAIAWLAVRWLPVPQWTFAAAIVTMLAGLPVILAATWLHRAPLRVRTPSPSSKTSTLDRVEAYARPRLTIRRALLGGVVALSGLTVVVVGWVVSRTLGIGPAATLRSRGVVDSTDRVLIAAFDSPSTDSTLGSMVSGLLRTALSRDGPGPIIPRAAEQRALVGMGLPAATAIGSSLATEVAQRANAKVHLVGALRSVGNRYVLRGTLIETSSGRELTEFQETAPSADGIIEAVDRLARQLRNQLGVSLREVRASPRLVWAVTPSMEALRRYSEGIRSSNRGEFAKAMQHWRAAIAVDSEFAMAYRALASRTSQSGNAAEADWAGARAFKYRDKLPQAEQRAVEGTYYETPNGFDPRRSIEAQERLSLDPARPNDGNNLAMAYLGVREPDTAIKIFERILKSDSMSIWAPQNILRAYWQAGRKDDARRHLQKLQRWQPNSRITARSTAWVLSAGFENDSAITSLQRFLAIHPSPSTAGDMLVFDLVRYYVIAGQFQVAESLRKELFPGRPGAINPSHIQRTLVHLLHGRPKPALEYLDSVTKALPPGSANALEYPWLELAELYARAGSPDRAREMVRGFERSANKNIMQFYRQTYEMAHGWIAFSERRYDSAALAFRAADLGACTVCALPPLAHAFDSARMTDSAIAVFERYLSANFLLRGGTDAQYLAAAYKRLGELYDERRDSVKAAHYYSRFADLWKSADADLQPQVKAARARVSELQASRRR